MLSSDFNKDQLWLAPRGDGELAGCLETFTGPRFGWSAILPCPRPLIISRAIKRLCEV